MEEMRWRLELDRTEWDNVGSCVFVLRLAFVLSIELCADINEPHKTFYFRGTWGDILNTSARRHFCTQVLQYLPLGYHSIRACFVCTFHHTAWSPSAWWVSRNRCIFYR